MAQFHILESLSFKMARRDGDKIFQKQKSELKKEAFTRVKDIRAKIPDIIIACEDESSAPTYLRMFVKDLIDNKQITQDSFVIVKHGHTNPIGVLKDLLSYKKDDKKYSDFEHKWIVIDRDRQRANGGGHNSNDFNSALSSAQIKK
ncbi:MAG: hypothetical protein RL154_1395, partial [Pseudomonadota bacterium]